MVSSGGFLFLVRVLIKYLNYSKPTIDQIRYEFDLRVKKNTIPMSNSRNGISYKEKPVQS